MQLSLLLDEPKDDHSLEMVSPRVLFATTPAHGALFTIDRDGIAGRRKGFKQIMVGGV